MINMDEIMGASMGEVSNDLTVTFKKTVLIRDYETEVIECVNSVKFDHGLVGIERMLAAAIMEVQMEYTAYCGLAAKGIITHSELVQRKEALVEGVDAVKRKADELIGEERANKLIKFCDEELKQ